MKKKVSTERLIQRFFKSPVQTIREERTLISFMIVGASGSLVNLVVLYLLHGSIGLIFAQAAGIEVSIVNNFVWNDSYTFKSVSKEENGIKLGKFLRFIKYNTLSLVTAALNLSVFYVLIYPLGLRQGYLYLGSSVIAVLVAFAFNYFGSSRWAWKKNTNTPPSAEIKKEGKIESGK